MGKRQITGLFILFTVHILLISLLTAQAETLRRGMSGQTVTELQTRLKNWGYYGGEVDGIYGSRTERAVKDFQRKNGLNADGIAGPLTLGAAGISVQPTKRENDVALLARLISAEARGEPYAGQVAVGAVVLNRMEHPSFPATLAGVIYQRGAFSCIADGQFDQPVSDSAYRAARDALNGWDPSGGAIYYYNPAKATSAWIWSRPTIVTIGEHKFCA